MLSATGRQTRCLTLRSGGPGRGWAAHVGPRTDHAEARRLQHLGAVDDTAHTPVFLRLPWVRIDASMACRLLGEVTLYGQFDQIFSLGCVAAVVPSVPADQRRELTRAWIQQGRITVWREIPSNGDQPVSNQILAPLYRSYATQIGMDLGTVVAPPPDKSGHKPATPAAADVPVSDRGNALPNTVDQSCPAHNWRSESHLTAKPEVVRWLKTVDAKLSEEEKNDVLGYKSGGGFLVKTTRISCLNKGTLIYRYYDAQGKASNAGGWWTTDLVIGDPRQTLALPPAQSGWSNSARTLARAQIAFDIPVLTGLGAPRCSNKPGGPQQWYIALADRKKNVLCHPDDPTKPFPRDP